MSWVAYIAPGVLALVGVGTLLWKSGRWAGSVDAQLAGFKKDLAGVKNDIGSLRKLVEGALSQSFVGSKSPVSLNDRGERAAKMLNASEWASERAGDLVAECEGLKE